MGETTCPKCGYINWHIYCHAIGKCKQCGKPITYCDCCKQPITKNEMDGWKKLFGVNEVKR